MKFWRVKRISQFPNFHPKSFVERPKTKKFQVNVKFWSESRFSKNRSKDEWQIARGRIKHAPCILKYVKSVEKDRNIVHWRKQRRKMADAISRRGEFRTKLFRARGAHRKSHQCTIESPCCALFYYSEDFEEIRAVTQRLMLSPFEKKGELAPYRPRNRDSTHESRQILPTIGQQRGFVVSSLLITFNITFCQTFLFGSKASSQFNLL